MKTVVVAGTGTEVGKTWLTAEILRRLRTQKVSVAVRKPVQSFEADSPDPTDAEVLAAASGEPAEVVCLPHRWLPVPMAPPMAADALGLPSPTLGELVAEIVWPEPRPRFGIVESVGGVRSPITVDGDTLDLADAIDADLMILVADAGLGTIDRVRLATAVLAPRPVVVFLNRFDPEDDLHRRNRVWLREHDLIDAVCDPDEVVARLSAG